MHSPDILLPGIALMAGNGNLYMQWLASASIQLRFLPLCNYTMYTITHTRSHISVYSGFKNQALIGGLTFSFKGSRCEIAEGEN